jgi:hypothetical protein
LARFIAFALPIAGYFLVSVFSAGRQTAFQIVLCALLMPLVSARTSGVPGPQRSRRTLTRDRITILAAVTTMVVYMGYVAVARNDGAISTDKAEVLARLFQVQVSPGIDRVLSTFGTGVRTALIEGMVYSSSPITLFGQVLTADHINLAYGAKSLPFIYRQLEPLTGISVVGTLQDTRALLARTGVAGMGWSTALSSYIIDFGFIGTGAVLWLQGSYAAYTWRRAHARGTFHDKVVAMLMLVNAIYMPFFPASGETSLLLLWLFCLGADRVHIASASGRVLRGARGPTARPLLNIK